MTTFPVLLPKTLFASNGLPHPNQSIRTPHLSDTKGLVVLIPTEPLSLAGGEQQQLTAVADSKTKAKATPPHQTRGAMRSPYKVQDGYTSWFAVTGASAQQLMGLLTEPFARLRHETPELAKQLQQDTPEGPVVVLPSVKDSKTHLDLLIALGRFVLQPITSSGTHVNAILTDWNNNPPNLNPNPFSLNSSRKTMTQSLTNYMQKISMENKPISGHDATELTAKPTTNKPLRGFNRNVKASRS